MKKSASGFSVVETCIVIVVLLVLAGGGYMLFRRHSTTPANTASSKTTTPSIPGTTNDVTNITSQDEQSESTINSSYSRTEQNSAASTDSAASDIGSAYDESSL